ncbi:PIN domain-containing protein [bacterium]|nr:MAG: PIN domain-containing protein [bacterium]
MAFSAFLDADVLFPVGLRDSLLWIAHFEVYSPRWSADVLKEMRKNILKEHKHVSEKDLDEMIRDMQTAFPEAEVTGYQKLIDVMPINEKDRHVLAAAVVAKVGVLVTNNLKHFPAEACGEFGVEVQSADEFLVHALSLEPFVVHEALSRQASIKRRPPMSVADVLDHLEKTAPTFANEARAAWEIKPGGP